ncbi:MAG: D-glycero-beta-D-manno-heptose 1,7-bisphosphate 7-phosphatase [Methylococcales bacterium]|nr:D-glycero-beta-D-manno-heptose 1,7-bisphosphate 7-phosphatase [Methylococcales bacterium]
MTQAAYVLIDRDGVINQDSEHFIKSPDEWQAIPGSLEAIALLNKHGYKVVVITNQSGLARGLFDHAMLELIHARMQRLTEQQGGKIDAIYVCPHGPDDHCTCRKPNPGLLVHFGKEKAISLSGIPFIGDSLIDLQAGLAVGAKPLLVKTGKGKRTLENNPDLNVPVFENLYDAAQFIISEQ